MSDLRVLDLHENPKNGFAVLRLHYTADPDKNPVTERGQQWYNTMRSRIGDRQKWNREYEIDFLSHVGKAIFPDFDKNKHIRKIEPIKGLKMIIGIDPGLGTSAAVWLQIVDDAEHTPQVRVYRELETHGADFTVLREKMIEINEQFYTDVQAPITYEIDIWGKAGAVAAKKGDTPVKILGRKGISAHYHKSGPEARITLKNHLLNSVSWNKEAQIHEPSYLVHPRCRQIIAGNCGLYRRKEESESIDKTEVVHLMDAEGYAYYNNLYLRFRDKPKRKPEKKRLTWLELLEKDSKKGKNKWMSC